MSDSKKWQLACQQPEVSHKLARCLNIDPLISQLLLNRGISSLEEAKSFLSPLTVKHIPFSDLQKAIAIICAAISDKKAIVVYGDYDVDGMTSTSMMVSFLRRLGGQVSYYIPHRFSDGYGLSRSFIEALIKQPPGLLITLDCGITNVEEIGLLKSGTSADVLILDHHTVPDPAPKADAILNPKLLAPEHPCYDLCTAGLVYMFLQAYAMDQRLDFSVEDYLDLAALGTVADIVSLVGQNRYIVIKGLLVLAKRQRIGLKALMSVAGLNKSEINSRDIGFVIAPMLNSAGRLDTAMKGIKLLLTDDETVAFNLATELKRLNDTRKQMGKDILQQSVKSLEAEKDVSAIVMANRTWHAGLIGITASQLAQKYTRPTVLIAVDGDIGRGSARTIGDVNIYSLLKSCSMYFSKFGGHKAAAGFSIPYANIEAFCDAFQTLCREQLSSHDLKETLRVDAILSHPNLSLDFAQKLLSIEPFGQGNREPLFYIKGLIPVDFKCVGDGSHLKATFVDKDRKMIIDGIGFGLGSKLPLLYERSVELLFHIDINEWNGQTRVQLKIVDIKTG